MTILGDKNFKSLIRMVIPNVMSVVKKEIKKEKNVIKGEMQQGMFNRTLILQHFDISIRKHIRTIDHRSLEICFYWFKP